MTDHLVGTNPKWKRHLNFNIFGGELKGKHEAPDSSLTQTQRMRYKKRVNLDKMVDGAYGFDLPEDCRVLLRLYDKEQPQRAVTVPGVVIIINDNTVDTSKVRCPDLRAGEYDISDHVPEENYMKFEIYWMCFSTKVFNYGWCIFIARHHEDSSSDESDYVIRDTDSRVKRQASPEASVKSSEVDRWLDQITDSPVKKESKIQYHSQSPQTSPPLIKSEPPRIKSEQRKEETHVEKYDDSVATTVRKRKREEPVYRSSSPIDDYYGQRSRHTSSPTENVQKLRSPTPEHLRAKRTTVRMPHENRRDNSTVGRYSTTLSDRDGHRLPEKPQSYNCDDALKKICAKEITKTTRDDLINSLKTWSTIEINDFCCGIVHTNEARIHALTQYKSELLEYLIKSPKLKNDNLNRLLRQIYGKRDVSKDDGFFQDTLVLDRYASHVLIAVIQSGAVVVTSLTGKIVDSAGRTLYSMLCGIRNINILEFPKNAIACKVMVEWVKMMDDDESTFEHILGAIDRQDPSEFEEYMVHSEASIFLGAIATRVCQTYLRRLTKILYRLRARVSMHRNSQKYMLTLIRRLDRNDLEELFIRPENSTDLRNYIYDCESCYEGKIILSALSKELPQDTVDRFF